MDITNQKERFRVSNRTSPFSESSESEYDSEAADDGDDGTDDEQPAQPFAQLIQAVSQSVCTKKPGHLVCCHGSKYTLKVHTKRFLPNDIVLTTCLLLDGRRAS